MSDDHVVIIHNDTVNANAEEKHKPIIYLCSASKLKSDVIDSLFDPVQYQRVNIEMPPGLTTEQPINDGIYGALNARIKHLMLSVNLNDGDKIIALENGIYINNHNYYDICCMMIYDQTTKTTNTYNSFGISIDPDLFSTYLSPLCNELMNVDYDPNDREIHGYDNTFGSFLNRKFNVSANNWMKDPRFGNVDRIIQMKDCCNKYLLDSHTVRIPDYPKPGVIFKHMTPIHVNRHLFNVLFSLLERIISDNFDINQVDFFAGLDSRGFWFAPTLARHFNKAFIPIRKASKLPPNTVAIKKAKYMTEYSSDEFALEDSKEFLPINGVKKTCIILDDLVATFGSGVGSVKVLTENNVNVIGFVTVFDVPELRDVASKTLEGYDLKCVVVVNENGKPNDFAPLKYKIPECMIKRIKPNDYDDTNTLDHFVRKYTMTDEQWKNNVPANLDIDRVRFIYTEKEKDLAEKIVKSTNLGFPLENVRVGITTGLFGNGETRVQLETSVRDMHVVVISQTRTGHINNDIMELLLILDACVRSGTSKITVVLPYYPYSRSDKKDHPRCPIAAALVAKLLTSSRIDNLISLDLHAGQIQGFIEKGFHNLYIRHYTCDDMFNHYLKFDDKSMWNNNNVIVAPDAGSARAVKCYSKILGINGVILDKGRDYSKPGTVISTRIIGSPDDLKNKVAFMIDDMADSFGTMCAAAKELVDYGVKYVIIYVTHGVLSGPAIDNINNSPHIKEVVVTDTLPQEHNLIRCPKLRVMTCSELIARSIDGVLTGRSISRLF